MSVSVATFLVARASLTAHYMTDLSQTSTIVCVTVFIIYLFICQFILLCTNILIYLYIM